MDNAAQQMLDKVSGEFESEMLAELQEGRNAAVALIQGEMRSTMEAVSKILATGEKRAESLKRQLTGASELEVRNSYLKSLDKEVSGIFAEAMKNASSVEGSRHEASIVQLIKEGIDIIGPKSVVSCNPRDKKVVALAVKKLSTEGVSLTLADEALESIGGVVMTSPDGTIKFDNTMEARLERLRPELRKEVASLLAKSQ